MRIQKRNVKVAALKPVMEDGQTRMVTYLAGRLGRDGASKVRLFLVISLTYMIFWGPLFTVTLINWSWEWKDAKKSLSHEVALHIAFVHSFVNPILFMILHRKTRNATCHLLTCGLPLDGPEPEPQAEKGKMTMRVETRNGTSGQHTTKLQGKELISQSRLVSGHQNVSYRDCVIDL